MAMLMVSHPSVCGLNIEKAFEELILIAAVLQFEEHLQEQGGQLLLHVEEDQVQGNQVQVEGNQLVLHVEDHGKWAS